LRKTCLGGSAAILVALGGITGTATAATTACAGADAVPTAGNIAVIRSAVACLVNEQRVSRGLSALRASSRLRVAAERHSADMVRRGYFSHVTPTGVSVRARLARVGIRRDIVGENIAWGMGTESTPLAIVDTWMHSPSHRANILSRRYTTAGVGIVLGAPGRPGADETATFTQVFAGR
jgi:uncharacterized protein YkwD